MGGACSAQVQAQSTHSRGTPSRCCGAGWIASARHSPDRFRYRSGDLCNEPDNLIYGRWPSRFGTVSSSVLEDYGALRSRRIVYSDGTEVEFGISGPSWAGIPLDAGTRAGLVGGVRILYDPKDLIRVASNAAAGA